MSIWEGPVLRRWLSKKQPSSIHVPSGVTTELALDAFHEAGHAVATITSRFHTSVASIAAHASGHGSCGPALSSTRCRNAGKPADRTDPDIAEDLALILYAGFAAEQIAAPLLGCAASSQAAASDYADADAALRFAGSTHRRTTIEGAAAKLMQREWRGSTQSPNA